MVLTSPVADVVIPEVPLHELIFTSLDKDPDTVCVIDGPTGRSYTRGQVKALSKKFAKGLIGKGLQKGDKLALFCPNLPEFLIVFLGVSAAGGAISTVNVLYTAEELSKQVKDSESKFLMTVPPFLDRAKTAAAENSIKEIIVLGDAEGENLVSFKSLLANDGELPSISFDVKKDVLALPYSSGTTGLSKGVMLSHYNIVSNLHQIHSEELLKVTESDVILAFLPFFHIYGMVVTSLYVAFAGGKIVCMLKFDPQEFLAFIDKYKVTIAPIVPPIALFLAKHPLVDKGNFSSLRLMVSGAAPLGKEVAELVQNRLKVELKQGFGMTEASPVTHFSPNKAKHGSVGVVIRNTEVKIVDVDTLEEKSVNQEGELWVRGPQVMLGYLNNPKATAETITSDGWLRTGDIGYYDEENYFFVVDRLKELIKYKGYQVPPAELEALLLTHAAVMDVAVIGIPDEEAGEIPRAFVVKKPNVEATAEELIDFVTHKVSTHKKLRGGVEFVTEIPKSASGKILRRVLKEKHKHH